jgi:hypothetical protein
VEAVECTDLLKPSRATIREACQWYQKHVLKYRNAPIVPEIVDKMIADAVATGRREKTTTDLRRRLGAFTRTLACASCRRSPSRNCGSGAMT